MKYYENVTTNVEPRVFKDDKGVFARYWKGVRDREEAAKKEFEKRELERQESIEKIAFKLEPKMAEIYRVLKKSQSCFAGESGPVSISMDREDWRKLQSIIKELEC